MMHFGLRVSLLIAAAWGSLAAQRPFSVQIPVPKQHHDTYDADAAALEVMQKVMAKLDPQTQELVMGLMASGATPGALPPIEPDQMVAMIDQFGLRAHKQELIELFIHKSQILDLVPPEHRPLILPIFHDSLLAFIDGLSDDRLADRVSAMMKLGPNATRGEKILVLLSKIPTLQKLGQIVARIEGIPPDVSQALQSLESGIHTMTAEELTGVIGGLLGEEKIQRYQVRFADKVLAEASVGAVIRATIVEPGSSARQEVVAKLIKPYVLAGVPREMAIIDGLLEVVQEHGEFYQVGGMPLKDLFADLKAKLADELRVAKEQEHLVRAAEYYRGHRLVKVPKFFSGLSNQSVTFMEFLRGEKITDSFKGDAKRRAELARRLLRVMKFETLFSEPSTALFHGDPHAGNVMHITNDASEPYKIGLLDWGLMGEFERPQRLQMVQLSMALDHKSRKKIRSNVGGLLKDGLPRDAVRRADVFRLADEALQAKGTTAEVYAKLVEQLARHGFLLDGDFALFIKSQLTLDGIYRELDPTLDPDEYLKKMASRQVRRELPKRLLLFPALGYRGYRSMLSNGEVFFGAFH